MKPKPKKFNNDEGYYNARLEARREPAAPDQNHFTENPAQKKIAGAKPVPAEILRNILNKINDDGYYTDARLIALCKAVIPGYE